MNRRTYHFVAVVVVTWFSILICSDHFEQNETCLGSGICFFGMFLVCSLADCMNGVFLTPSVYVGHLRNVSVGRPSMASLRVGPRDVFRNGEDPATSVAISLKRSGKTLSYAGLPPNLIQTNKVLNCRNNPEAHCFKPEHPLSASFSLKSQVSGTSLQPFSVCLSFPCRSPALSFMPPCLCYFCLF